MAEDGKMKGKVSINRFWAGRSLRMKEEEEVEIGDVKMEGAAFLSLSLSHSCWRPQRAHPRTPFLHPNCQKERRLTQESGSGVAES